MCSWRAPFNAALALAAFALAGCAKSTSEGAPYGVREQTVVAGTRTITVRTDAGVHTVGEPINVSVAIYSTKSDDPNPVRLHIEARDAAGAVVARRETEVPLDVPPGSNKLECVGAVVNCFPHPDPNMPTSGALLEPGRDSLRVTVIFTNGHRVVFDQLSFATFHRRRD